ncbi:MAG TPA: energy-coupling factor ABC transporter permease [Dehalococcoidia bacterium]|nr:energy-coupling factor ABC transporter permease [Dehalococcoidia bacterium]
MHIPDGFLNVATAASTYMVSAGGVGFALKEVGRKLGEKHIPLVGVTGAFIFAAQMLNFPIVGGTSGHLLGAALAAILLGPWTGLLVMSCVLLVQSLLFQDGGLLALGANVFNMGVVGCFVGYFVYRGVASLLRYSRKGILTASFVAAWGAVMAASIFCALELAISGTSPLKVALPAMAGFHALIGIGEGAITAAVLSFVLVTRRDLLELRKI